MDLLSVMGIPNIVNNPSLIIIARIKEANEPAVNIVMNYAFQTLEITDRQLISIAEKVGNCRIYLDKSNENSVRGVTCLGSYNPKVTIESKSKLDRIAKIQAIAYKRAEELRDSFTVENWNKEIVVDSTLKLFSSGIAGIYLAPVSILEIKQFLEKKDKKEKA